MNQRYYQAIRFLQLLLALSAALSGLATSDKASGQTVSPEVLSRAKQSTVFIRAADGEGTGFLIERNATSGIIATAAHVVAPGEPGTNREVEVFFSSGTEAEYGLTATVIGLDEAKDVAFLRVKASNLPEPIYMAPDAPVSETMDVVIAGFPFGGQISLTSRNPTLTISKGSISSIKQGMTDSVALLQLDVSVNPGNSGGPVLNSQGGVIGIISSKVQGTQLGFAIPAATAMRDYMGDCADVLGTFPAADNPKDCKLYGKLIDPLRRVETVSINFAAIASLPSLDLRSNKEWPQLPSKAELNCKLQNGEFDLDMKLPVAALPLDETVAQVVCHRVDGTTCYSAPLSLKRLKDEYFECLSSKKDSDRPMSDEPDDRGPERPTPRPPKRVDPSDPLHPALAATHLASVAFDSPELISSTQFPKRGVLSELVKIGNVGIRRVLIPDRGYSPQVLWNESGDKLMLVSRELTLIDYPTAKRVEIYKASSQHATAEVVGDTLWMSLGNGLVSKLDLSTMKPIQQWRFNRKVRSQTSLRHWLVIPTDSQPLEAYLCDEERGIQSQALDLTANKALPRPVEIFMPRNGDSLFAWGGGQISRFSLVDGGSRFEESAHISVPFEAEPSFLRCSDDQIVGLCRTGPAKTGFGSQLAIFTGGLQQQHAVEVPDWITCMASDAKRHRCILGGTEGIWAWSPQADEPYRLPFPSSAVPVSAMALHPNGQTLAVLCGGYGHSALYLVDLTNSGEPPNN